MAVEDTPLVDDVDTTSGVQGVRERVEKLKQRSATLAAKGGSVAGNGAGKAKPKKGMSPEVKARLKAGAKASRDNDCKCGCGGKTGGSFSVGHDARYYGWLKKVAAGNMEFKELPRVVQKDLVDLKGVRAALAKSKH